jgi:hypothetical protein
MQIELSDEMSKIYVILADYETKSIAVRAFTSRKKALRYRDAGNANPKHPDMGNPSYRIEACLLNGADWLPVNI